MIYSTLSCLEHFAVALIPIQSFAGNLGIEIFSETVSEYTLDSSLTHAEDFAWALKFKQ